MVAFFITISFVFVAVVSFVFGMVVAFRIDDTRLEELEDRVDELEHSSNSKT